MADKMVILGIDPGTAKMGWGILRNSGSGKRRKIHYVSHGVIETPSTHSRGRRLSSLRREVASLIKKYQVEEVAAEKIFFNINKKTAIKVSQALGVVHLAAAEKKIPITEYNALRAKLLLTGHGRADKKVVQKEVKKRLGLKKPPTPVHAADALAIALCHLLESDAG
jgi:crossover junction endodeoxyribonuclease RuvC